MVVISLVEKIKNSLSSFLILFIKNKIFIRDKSYKEIFNQFKGKNILIIGSGPSLIKLNDEILNKYDFVFAINKSIEYALKFRIKNLILFSCDTRVIYEIFKKENLSIKKIILIPQQTYYPIKLIKLSRKENLDIIWPSYKVIFHQIKRLNLKIPQVVAKVNGENHLIDWITNKNQKNVILLPHSSFFTLAAILIKVNANKISSIGVDFTTFYASVLNEKNPISTHGEEKPNLYWKFFRKEILNKFTKYNKY